MARPKNEKKIRYKRLEVRLTEADYQDLHLRAANNFMKVSDYVRRVVFDDRFKHIHTDYDVYKEIRALHADLNRLGNWIIGKKSFTAYGARNLNSMTDRLYETIEHLAVVRDHLQKIMLGIK